MVYTGKPLWFFPPRKVNLNKSSSKEVVKQGNNQTITQDALLLFYSLPYSCCCAAPAVLHCHLTHDDLMSLCIFSYITRPKLTGPRFFLFFLDPILHSITGKVTFFEERNKKTGLREKRVVCSLVVDPAHVVYLEQITHVMMTLSAPDGFDVTVAQQRKKKKAHPFFSICLFLKQVLKTLTSSRFFFFGSFFSSLPRRGPSVGKNWEV